MNPKETVEKFIETILREHCLFEDAKKFLTVTQQTECIYIAFQSIEPHLTALHSTLKLADTIDVKEVINTAKFIKDVIITMKKDKGSVKLQCRLVKEVGVRKTGEEGTWGINMNSFKEVK